MADMPRQGQWRVLQWIGLIAVGIVTVAALGACPSPPAGPRCPAHRGGRCLVCRGWLRCRVAAPAVAPARPGACRWIDNRLVGSCPYRPTATGYPGAGSAPEAAARVAQGACGWPGSPGRDGWGGKVHRGGDIRRNDPADPKGPTAPSCVVGIRRRPVQPYRRAGHRRPSARGISGRPESDPGRWARWARPPLGAAEHQRPPLAAHLRQCRRPVRTGQPRLGGIPRGSASYRLPCHARGWNRLGACIPARPSHRHHAGQRPGGLGTRRPDTSRRGAE